MKLPHRALFVAFVLLLAYFFARVWFASAWSEHFWTWLNDALSAGVDPGLASDAEMIIVLLLAPILAVGISLLLVQIGRLISR